MRSLRWLSRTQSVLCRIRDGRRRTGIGPLHDDELPTICTDLYREESSSGHHEQSSDRPCRLDGMNIVSRWRSPEVPKPCCQASEDQEDIGDAIKPFYGERPAMPLTGLLRITS